MNFEEDRLELIRYRLWLYERRPDRVNGYKFVPDGSISGIRHCVVCGNGFERAVPHQKRCDNCIVMPAVFSKVDEELASKRYLPIGWKGGSLNTNSTSWEPPEGAGSVDSFTRRSDESWESIRSGRTPHWR